MINHALFVTRSATDPGAYPKESVAVSGTSTYYSKRVAPRGRTTSISLEWTGTPTGAFTAWVSDKEDPNEANDADWQQFTWTSTNPAGTDSAQRSDFVDLGARWLRIKYVNASGAGEVSGRATVGC